eukprot:1684073-Rhodomonas_salina.1
MSGDQPQLSHVTEPSVSLTRDSPAGGVGGGCDEAAAFEVLVQAGGCVHACASLGASLTGSFQVLRACRSAAGGPKLDLTTNLNGVPNARAVASLCDKRVRMLPVVR